MSYFSLHGIYIYSFYAGLESIKRTVFINILYGMGISGIDHGAHIGGFLGGAAFSYLFGPRLVALKTAYGRGKIVDKPLINYIKYFKMFDNMLFSDPATRKE
jgi:hypothetical protein